MWCGRVGPRVRAAKGDSDEQYDEAARAAEARTPTAIGEREYEWRVQAGSLSSRSSAPAWLLRSRRALTKSFDRSGDVRLRLSARSRRRVVERGGDGVASCVRDGDGCTHCCFDDFVCLLLALAWLLLGWRVVDARAEAQKAKAKAKQSEGRSKFAVNSTSNKKGKRNHDNDN